MAAPLLAPGARTRARWSNWSGGVVAQPRRVAIPASEAELAAVLRSAEGPVRAAGTGHSFTPLCAGEDTIISLDAQQGVIAVDAATARARVRAGTKIHALGRPLHDAGVALKNQGDIDRQAIAGAVSTGTHGTGTALPCLAAEVVALRLMTADGGIVAASPVEEPELFEAARLGLGAVGILLELTLSVRPAYRLREENRVVPVAELLPQLDALKTRHRHVEFFWFPEADHAVLKTLDETDEAAPAPRDAAGMAARGEQVTQDQRRFERLCRLVRLAPWTARYVQRLVTREMTDGRPRVRWSHEAFPSPRNVRFNEMEYALPADRALAALQEVVASLRRRRIATAFPFEVRFVKGDDLWLSPFHGRDSATIAVHQYYRHDTRALFEMAETVFRHYGGRPHWGKMHSLSGTELAALYPKWDAFHRVRRQVDPRGRFLNAYLRRLFGEGEVG